MAMADITVTTEREAEIELFPVGPQGIDFIVEGGGGGEPYTGPYSVTPSQEQQIIPVANKTPTRDIVVEPIPQNYGLITYNGSVITVS